MAKIYQQYKTGNVTFGVPVREMIIHCAAIKSGMFDGLPLEAVRKIIKDWHLVRGFSDIGYHYIAAPTGKYILGRPLHISGAHVSGRNRGTLGVLIIESREITKIGDFSDYFTVEQLHTLRRLCKLHEIEKVSGHNDYAAKLCPGFKVSEDMRKFLLS